MIAKELKRSILLAAISGKLTVQEQYESAHKLFDIKDIITEYISFDLPDNWVWTKLGVIGSWKAGATPLRSKSEYYKNGTIPWLKTGDLNNSYINSVTEFITLKAIEETSITIQPIGAILIAMYGATIGKLGILNIEATTNQACCACTVNEKINNKYLFYYLMAIKDEFVGKGVGGAQPNISKEKIVKTLISVPPIEEQKRIVEKLDELLPLIDSLEKDELKLNELMQKFPESMKASILQLAIQGKLTTQNNHENIEGTLLIEYEKNINDFKKSEYYFEVPTNWVWSKIDTIFKKENKSKIQAGGAKLSGEYKFYNSSPVQSKYYNSFIFDGDGLIFGTGGVPSIHYVTGKFSYSTDCILYSKKSDIDITLTYVYYAVLAFRDQLSNGFKGSTIKHISHEYIKEFIIPVPPLKEQKRIVDKLNELLPIVSQLNNA